MKGKTKRVMLHLSRQRTKYSQGNNFFCFLYTKYQKKKMKGKTKRVMQHLPRQRTNYLHGNKFLVAMYKISSLPLSRTLKRGTGVRKIACVQNIFIKKYFLKSGASVCEIACVQNIFLCTRMCAICILLCTCMGAKYYHYHSQGQPKWA